MGSRYYELALEAIRNLSGDEARTSRQTKSDLMSLIDEIEELLQALLDSD